MSFSGGLRSRVAPGIIERVNVALTTADKWQKIADIPIGDAAGGFALVTNGPSAGDHVLMAALAEGSFNLSPQKAQLVPMASGEAAVHYFPPPLAAMELWVNTPSWSSNATLTGTLYGVPPGAETDLFPDKFSIAANQDIGATSAQGITYRSLHPYTRLDMFYPDTGSTPASMDISINEILLEPAEPGGSTDTGWNAETRDLVTGVTTPQEVLDVPVYTPRATLWVRNNDAGTRTVDRFAIFRKA